VLSRAAGGGRAVSRGIGYPEIHLNVGCPSDRVQAGRFGACLMREPALLAECLSAMRRGQPMSSFRKVSHRRRRPGAGTGAAAS